MSDIARLGIAIDSSQIDKGIISLTQFGGADGKAEVATQRLGTPLYLINGL